MEKKRSRHKFDLSISTTGATRGGQPIENLTYDEVRGYVGFIPSLSSTSIWWNAQGKHPYSATLDLVCLVEPIPKE